MKGKGYYLSLEAVVSLALLGLLLAVPIQQSKIGLNDLHLFKKENDLLLFWARQERLEEGEMVKGFLFAFPNKSGEIFLDGKRVSIGEPGKEAIASKAVFFDRHLKKHEIRLIVFKEDFS